MCGIINRWSILRIIGTALILLAVIIGGGAALLCSDYMFDGVICVLPRVGSESSMYLIRNLFIGAATIVGIFIGSLIWGWGIRRDQKTVVGVAKIEKIVHGILFYSSGLITALLIGFVLCLFLSCLLSQDVIVP
jgi:hypothetical protein